MTEQEQRLATIEEAKSWIGTGFHYGAQLKGVGIACGPFLLASHAAWSEDCKNTFLKPLAKDWHFHTRNEVFLEQVQRFCRRVDKALPGDLAMFRLGSKDRPYSHGAIIVAWPQVIHAHFRSGCEYADASKDVLLLSSSEISFWSPWQGQSQPE